jgi:hypothetical protein
MPRLWSWELVVAAVCMLPLGLVAQVSSEELPDAGFEDSYLEEAIVTGTRIARRDFNTTNLLNPDSPMMADQGWENNTDTGLYDVYGRSYRLSFLAEF